MKTLINALRRKPSHMPDNRSNTPRNSDFAPQLQRTTDRPLPKNIEAEQSVLAACMLDAEAVEELVLKLKPENFFRPAHQHHLRSDP